MRLLLLLITFLFSSYLFGQSTLSYTGGASLGSLSYTSSSHRGVISLYGNPAGLTHLSNWGGDVGYARRFNLDELATINLAAGVKTSLGHFGLVATRFGSDAYSETKIGIAYARKLFANLSVGVNFDRIQYDASAYGNSSIYTFDVGVMSQLTPDLILGVSVFNPLALELNSTTVVPARYVVGVDYKASSKSGVMADLEKRSDRDLEFKVSVYYDLLDELRLSAGAQVRNSAFHFGMLYRLGKLNVTGSFGIDNRIGNTPAVSLGYQE